MATQEKKREVLHYEAKEIVSNVLTYLDNEKSNRGYSFPVEQVMNRVSYATGYSITTIRRIKSENGNKSAEDARKAKRNRMRVGPNKIILDDLDYCVLRNIIHSFYIAGKQLPTLDRILPCVKTQLNFAGSRDTLRKLIKHKLGFEVRRINKGHQLLVERHDIKLWRATYLLRMKRNDDLMENRKPVVYLDGTWLQNKKWILIHAGGDTGFIDDTKLLFKCESQGILYETEIDKPTYINWLKEKLIANLLESSIIVLDNGPYCNTVKNKIPKPNAKRSVMIDWLLKNKITFEDTMLKAELYYLIKRNRPQKLYMIDDILEAAGHEAVHMPPYCSELNPLKGIWMLIKQRLDQTIGQTEKMEILINSAIASITVDDWVTQIYQAKQKEQEYWDRDVSLDEKTELMIQVIASDSESGGQSSDEAYVCGLRSNKDSEDDEEIDDD